MPNDQDRDRFDAAVAEARLEAARALAYGAGHEINNPLANIAARAQALLVDEKDPERRRKLATIVDQAFRARDMIGGLMVFARPPKPNPVAIDLHDLVRGVVESLRGAVEARAIRLGYSPPPQPMSVRLDAAQVAEALRALAQNAVEAVADGGAIVVEAIAVPEGARVTIADDGPGMSSEAARRLFDPFFSGRDAGRGIGLGLPKALRLIEANEGRLDVESTPGRGTTVTVRLPGGVESAALA